MARFPWRLAGRAIDLLVESVIWLSSNKQFFAGFVIITVWWYLFPARFGDTAKDNYPRMVFWYTIVYGTWEGATKIVQAIQSKRDEHARALLQQTLESSQQTLRSVEEIAVDIRNELEHSVERDEAARVRDEQASMRDSVLIGLVRELIDRLGARA